MSLSNLERNISLLRLRAIALLNYKVIALLRNISFDIPITSFMSFTFSVSVSSQIVKLLETGIDEEWRGFVSEQKHEWSKLRLIKKQVQDKTMISIIALHWDRLKSWMQLLMILSWVKSQLIYK